MKYHINPKTGKVSGCRATKKCPFGGVSGQENHFESKQAAEAFSENYLTTRYGMSTVSKSNFSTVRDNIKAGLLASGVISNANSLPPVESKKEMIEKWFGGDTKKFEVIARISSPQAGVKAATKKSVGKLINSGLDVSMTKDFTKAPKVRNSNVEIIDESDDDQIDLQALREGRLKPF